MGGVGIDEAEAEVSGSRRVLGRDLAGLLIGGMAEGVGLRGERAGLVVLPKIVRGG